MSHEDPSFATSLMAGGLAGTAVDIALFPLDTLKTRLQSEAGFMASGGFRSIYSGLGPAALVSAPNAALFFCTYDTMKNILGNHVPSNYLPGVHMAAASTGEVVACMIRVPMEMVKQRRQAKLSDSSIQVICDILRKEGPKGLFRGYLSTVAREIPFSLIQYPLWESLKKYWSEKQGRNVDSWQSALCGGIAGGFAGALTTPLDVAKTRIMLAHHEDVAAKGHIDKVLRIVYQHQGLSGLFAGVVPRTLSISAGGVVFFGVYEKAKWLLKQYTEL